MTLQAIDADAHVDENEETWEYLGEADSRFRPVSFDLTPGEKPFIPGDARPHRLWLISGNARLRRYRDDKASGTTRETRELIDVPARLRHMDELGIDTQVLFTTLFLHAVTAIPEVQVALFKAYNRWIAAKTGPSEGRLRWVAVMPTLDMDETVAEVRFAKENGAAAVMKIGIECGHRPAGDPYFYPLYKAAQDVDIAMCFHQGTGDPAISNAGPGSGLPILNVLSAFQALANARVPEKFPNLRWGFIEAGASWIPYILKELGMRGKSSRYEFDFKTEFLERNNFFVTCDNEDDLGPLLEHGCEDHLVIGTDYTHVDSASEMEAHKNMAAKGDQGIVSTKVAQKIIRDNGRRLYGL